jgi:hypothetical protein
VIGPWSVRGRFVIGSWSVRDWFMVGYSASNVLGCLVLEPSFFCRRDRLISTNYPKRRTPWQ